MTNITFRVVLQKDHTYHVEFVRPDGSARTVTGFQSEHEARAWSIQTERMMIAADRQPTITRREGRQSVR